MKARLGNIVLFFLLSIVIAGFILGLIAGHAVPDFWD